MKKDNSYQLVRVNGGLDNCLTSVREICGSSDSGSSELDRTVGEHE